MTTSNSPMRNITHVLMIVGASLLACLYYWNSLLDSQAAALTAAHERSELRANQLNAAIEQQLDATLRSVDTALRHLRNVYVHDRANFDQAARDVLESYPKNMLQFVTVFGPEGYLAYSSNQGKPVEPAKPALYFGDREHFRVHADSEQDQIFISKPIIGRIAGVPLIQITRPIRDGKRFLGVIGIPIRPEYLSNNMGSLRIDPADVLAIVRPDGRLIARSHHLDEALKTTLPPDRPFLKAEAGASGVFRSVSTVDKVPLLFSWQHLAAWPVITVAAINEEAELGGLNRHLQAQRESALLSMGLLVFFSLGIALLIVRLNRNVDELSRSQARHRSLFDHAKVPTLLVDLLDGAIVDANQAAESFYGYPRAALRKMCISEINQHSPEEIREEMALAREEKRDCFYFPHRLASGEIRQVEVHSGPLEIDGRHLLYSFIHDITERRSTELALASETARLSALLQTASDGIHILDENGHLELFSASFASMLGYSDDEIRYLNVADWDASIPRDQLASFIPELIRTAKKFETRHRCRDGRLLDVEINAKGLEIAGRKFLYASSRDISERKAAEKELDAYRHRLEERVEARTNDLSVAKEAAEAANRAKSVFLATMSHELRTPMNGIMGMTEIILRNATDPQQKDQLAKLKISSARLLAVINDILDISKIEAERLTLENNEFKLGKVLENIRELLETKANEKQLEFTLEIDPVLANRPLQGDPLRLGQVLQNLIANALKFTALGSVTTLIRQQEESEHDLLLRCEVRDTGIGIEPEDQKRLFSAFEQADHSMTRKYGGTGLGLAISKRLIQMMGGEIGLESRPGQGSVFWFTARLRKNQIDPS